LAGGGGHSSRSYFSAGGAKIHMARYIMAWFVENNIQVVEWLCNFPELAPIEDC